MSESRAEGVDDEQSSLAELCSSLPLELSLLILSRLPSPLLFACRILSKAVRRAACLALARRPFIIYQNPSFHCFLLPLDAPSTPLPCSFRLAGESPFKLVSTSSNLVCLARRHKSISVLDICICSFFCKWKVDLPPIMHPRYASRFYPSVLVEDRDVNSLGVLKFEALPTTTNPHASHGLAHAHVQGAGSPENSHLHVPDGNVHANDGFPCNICHNVHHFRVLVGGLSISHSVKTRVFDSHHQQWLEHDQSLHIPSTHKLKAAGEQFQIWYDEGACKLKVRFPHVKDAHDKGLVLEAVCPTDRAVEYKGVCEGNSDREYHAWYVKSPLQARFSDHHFHFSRRHLAHSSLLWYGDMVYLLLIDFEELSCINSGQRCRFEYHIMTTEEATKYLWADRYLDNDRTQHSPAVTPCRLMLFTVQIDTTRGTLRLSRDNASALLELSNMSKPLFPFNRRDCMGDFVIMDGGGAPQ